MSKVELVKDSDGNPRKNKDGKYIFSKEGVYFTLDEESMKETRNIINDILDDAKTSQWDTFKEVILNVINEYFKPLTKSKAIYNDLGEILTNMLMVLCGVFSIVLVIMSFVKLLNGVIGVFFPLLGSGVILGIMCYTAYKVNKLIRDESKEKVSK